LKELKGFKKVQLRPGESKKITFTITEDQLRYHHANLDYKSDRGTFELFIGPHSAMGQKFTFKLEK